MKTKIKKITLIFGFPFMIVGFVFGFIWHGLHVGFKLFNDIWRE